MTNSDQDPTTIINRSGGTELNASGDITIGGDVVGRDKVINVAGDNVAGNKIINTGDQQYDVRGLANPYLGLQSFIYADHAKYAGREKLIAATVARLTDPANLLTLFFVTGASGSGKSSFVQAGVLPALEQWYDQRHQTVSHAVFRPSREPLLMWQDALSQLGKNIHQLNDLVQLDQINVIIIDQFEELFTQSNAQSRAAFFALLAQLPPFDATRTHLIATVRVDYLPELFTLPALYDIAKRGLDLHAMSSDELREAIQQPLRVTYPDQDKRFQSELVERLAQDAAEDAAYLPLLQVTLKEIWRQGTLTVGAYTNLADAVKQRADKVLAYQDYDDAQPHQPRSAEEQTAILSLCLDLVDVSLDDEARRDVRRRRSKDELTSGAPDRARLIDALTQARLLSIAIEGGEQPRVEVDLIHETLLSNWDRLRQAIVDQRHGLRQRARFEQQLKEWIGQDRSDDYLLSGARLAEARELELRNDITLRQAGARDYLRSSEERETARQQKELNDVKRVAEAAQARARAERRSNLLLRILLVSTLLIIAVLLMPYLAELAARVQAQVNMVDIPAGSFVFGQPSPQIFKLDSLELLEWQQQNVYLDAYLIDKYPVTNRAYALCVNVAHCSPPLDSEEWPAAAEKQGHPVVNISVVQAAAYCQWLGKRLPTEAEWERAARGVDGRPWPWDASAPTLEYANMPYGQFEPRTTVPVDATTAGGSPEGVYDLVGNVWEWTSSYSQPNRTRYDRQAYWNGLAGDFPKINADNPKARQFILRGGSWKNSITRITSAASYLGFLFGNNVGFRCASSAKPPG